MIRTCSPMAHHVFPSLPKSLACLPWSIVLAVLNIVWFESFTEEKGVCKRHKVVGQTCSIEIDLPTFVSAIWNRVNPIEALISLIEHRRGVQILVCCPLCQRLTIAKIVAMFSVHAWGEHIASFVFTSIMWWFQIVLNKVSVYENLHVVIGWNLLCRLDPQPLL